MANFHRLSGRKYGELEGNYFLQSTDMLNLDPDVLDLSVPAVNYSERLCGSADHTWSVNNHYERRRRRNTVSIVDPPAPPSTPTLPALVMANGCEIASAAGSTIESGIADLSIQASNRKATSRIPLCSDNQLADLLSVVSIKDRPPTVKSRNSKQQFSAERGISNASRTIAKHIGTKIFKIHRSPREFLNAPPDEDSVSAPEYDTEEEDTRFRYFSRLKSRRRYTETRRERKLARFTHQERMESIMERFGAATDLNDQN